MLQSMLGRLPYLTMPMRRYPNPEEEALWREELETVRSVARRSGVEEAQRVAAQQTVMGRYELGTRDWVLSLAW